MNLSNLLLLNDSISEIKISPIIVFPYCGYADTNYVIKEFNNI
jgi:hypothetical protein